MEYSGLLAMMLTKMSVTGERGLSLFHYILVGINTEPFMWTGSWESIEGYCTKALSWTLYDKQDGSLYNGTKESGYDAVKDNETRYTSY
jgi:hypothetical protein